MERYPGPSDSGRKVTRNYFIGLLVGIAVMIVGILANGLGLALGGVEVIDPGARTGDEGEAVIEIDTQASPVLGISITLVGAVVSLGSVYRFNNDVGGIPNYQGKTRFVGLGLIVTAAFLIVGLYASITFFQ